MAKIVLNSKGRTEVPTRLMIKKITNVREILKEDGKLQNFEMNLKPRESMLKILHPVRIGMMMTYQAPNLDGTSPSGEGVVAALMVDQSEEIDEHPTGLSVGIDDLMTVLNAEADGLQIGQNEVTNVVMIDLRNGKIK